jgi:hypothetical protein
MNAGRIVECRDCDLKGVALLIIFQQLRKLKQEKSKIWEVKNSFNKPTARIIKRLLSRYNCTYYFH